MEQKEGMEEKNAADAITEENMGRKGTGKRR